MARRGGRWLENVVVTYLVIVAVGAYLAEPRGAHAQSRQQPVEKRPDPPFFQLGIGYADPFALTEVSGLTAQMRVVQSLTPHVLINESVSFMYGAKQEGKYLHYVDVALGVQWRSWGRGSSRAVPPFKHVDLAAFRVGLAAGVSSMGLEKGSSDALHMMIEASFGYLPACGDDYCIGAEIRGKALTRGDPAQFALDYLLVVDLQL